MAKKKKRGKLTKWLEIQIGFIYYSQICACNVRVLSIGTNELTFICERLDNIREAVTLPSKDLSKAIL